MHAREKEKENENFCEYVSSYGIIKSCEIRSMTPQFCRFINYNFDFFNERAIFPDYTVIYVCNADMRSFVRSGAFARIKTKFVLVSGDADETCPIDILSKDEFENMLENENLVHWYSQNCVVADHPKLTQMPIGLDYHSIARGGHEWGDFQTPVAQERELKAIEGASRPFWERELKCYSNFHFLLNTKFSADRFDAMKEIPLELIHYEPTKTKRANCFNKQTEFAFVLSPHGNGYDCHRTWESLVLGNIVIIKTSPLDPLYADLPIWIVREWSEVRPDRMREIVAEFKARAERNEFKYEKLTLDYWRDQFFSWRRGAARR